MYQTDKEEPLSYHWQPNRFIRQQIRQTKHLGSDQVVCLIFVTQICPLDTRMCKNNKKELIN